MSTLSSDIKTLSHEAYTFLYSLVTMEVTRLQSTNVAERTGAAKGPANTFVHIREFPSADFRSVVRPNFDTLYSSGWLDLTNGPQIVHAPGTNDRYYMLPMLDMWTDVFANPGKRTTGTAAADFLVAGPGWAGEVPDGMTLIQAPTPHVWIIGRTQTNGPGDYTAVHAVQDGLTIRALDPASVVEPTVDPSVDMTTEPLKLVNSLSAVEFFGWAAKILAVNPPHATDFSVMARIARLGIVPGQPFDASGFSADQLAEFEAGAKAAQQEFMLTLPKLGTHANGWTSYLDTMGVYGNFYLKRSIVTLVGLGANPVEDAIYPLLISDSDGNKLLGENSYVIHFDVKDLPPVFAFWSITMYDEEGYQVANELDRFAIGDRDALTYNPDGSLDIYLQHTNPGSNLESNWLPTSESGALGITMRLYGPKAEAISGIWTPPVVMKTSA
ncbi:DUF1254 domain-containing protein [Subtercola endophyticus]|uniref:DUF1254 domain-containing protein n=1 Tax=Subtercola endophyticus TaxID=2895559 RepID=UPI001E30E64B|nr:DUF1254 domain-containing protein [Subtercola endophyticus]UFS58167.1 DUF1254 domain-containing protein [Subtercola endophyticus]